MPEIASADKQQLISKIERFFERNASENITRYVLGSTKISRCVKRMRDVPAYFNNIFSLAFLCFEHICQNRYFFVSEDRSCNILVLVEPVSFETC